MDVIEHGCRVIAEAMQEPEVAGVVPGIHLEGPYISPLDGPRGAHPREHVRNPDLREFNMLYKAARRKIVYITMAPELDGAPRFIKGVTARGVKVALGHHNGNAEQIAEAVDAGARLSTHLGNGLASTIHRHLNPLWPQLADDRLTAALIADLQHLPAATLKTFVRAKRPENTILTSDCVHIAGLAPGRYKLGSLDVELLPSGRICLSGTDLLAGSSLMLLQGVVNAYEATDLSLEQAFASASTIPAQHLGIKRRFSLPKVGAKADLVLFDIEKDARGSAKAIVRSVFTSGTRRL
jgi:N-acetylglucosamine-6-phosphate deacetylase